MSAPSQSFHDDSPGASDAPVPHVPADPRAVVCHLLTRQAGRFPRLELLVPETRHLCPRDAALAHAIYDAVLRRWITLAHVLNRYLHRPMHSIEPALRAVLLAGAAQLLLLDRIPAHAAVDESVSWADRAIRRGAAAMVNAVLRRVAALRAAGTTSAEDRPALEPSWLDRRDVLPLSDGTLLPLTDNVLPDDGLSRLAVGTSHPAALLQRWRRQVGESQAVDRALHDLVRAPVVLNIAAASAPLTEPHLQRHEEPGHALFTGDADALRQLLTRRRDVWVQDAASAGGVRAVAHLRPRLVVDFCAGTGTKSRQLLAQFPDAELVATDVHPGRLAALGALLADEPRACVVAPGELLERFAGRADLVVLDVPCSNTGVLARRLEARYRFGRRELSRLCALQRRVLQQTAALRASGGVTLYLTCSLEGEENQAQTGWWRRRGGAVLSGWAIEPRGLPGQHPAVYRDGAFGAILT